ncbi:TPA: zinc ribbon domain-containing protein [candidate division CPR2 bacterium]|uniref:Putative regulatory protein FmdB zinc ribbon domain-containing protein n=1 Tax=candidate division CPR2 bacterium GW2011_GWC1_41_48 TaxID=1618344 RepID=A0A0G0Z892_UNCC2|nr:MAG: hypothetical protein UT47_C0002G0283 [candidate division CPR2 bacterium GW2011_GWC2_39_35]KKR28431.1 MAG: hypothetical protein UT60_C0020G0001 [candidate division CPR2 bacterium GW2011_GWD2_39_7]KKS09243.1 MAG: hypothetical protein UU65_C0002G0021 [candidate division CPR2 bacterium GW2011_GWC1_41_48]OGB72660.1 MAG: hypothetical protein A2Y26_02160 [candidate division CPR2 bacterium GWD2_39_7]HBG81998.1 zinc ribbon domain-containing protein [candidate division CPR2 bacterium]
MPIYEYHCEECNADFEHLKASSDKKDEANCPACKSKKTTKKGVSNFSSTGNGGCGSGCGGCHGSCG